MLNKIFTILIISTFLSSCVITEDIYFAENSSAKYNFSIDVSEIMKNKNENEFKGVPNNDTISIAKILRDSISEINDMPVKYVKLLKELEAFYLNPQINNEENTFVINIFGNFDNVEHLNNGMLALSQTQELVQYLSRKSGEDIEEDEQSIPTMNKIAQYSQNGNSIKRTYINLHPSVAEDETIDESEENRIVTKLATGMVNSMMEQMLSLGKYHINYHFHKPIDKVEGDFTELSDDKKTLRFTQPGMMFLNPELEDITIKLAD